MALRTVTETPKGRAGTCGLSLVMLARNAEATIGKALDSVRGVCNEMIVYLAGESTDNTADVAARHGATIIPGEWRDDFAWARNQAAKHASGKWLLSMDADEALHPDDVDALRELVNGYPQIVSLTILSELDDGMIQTYGARLIPNDPGIVWESALHEQPIDKRGKFGAIASPVRLTHTGYKSEAMIAGDKYARNLRLASKLCEEQPNNPYFRLFLAQTFQVDGKHLAAVDQYRLCVHLCRSYGETPDLAKLYAQAATGLVGGLNQLGYYTSAAAEGEQAAKFTTIRHPGFWVSMGNSYNHLSLGPDAVAAFEKALAYRQSDDIYQVDLGIATWKPYCGLAFAQSLCGRNAEAAVNLRTAYDLGAEEPQRTAIVEGLAALGQPI